MQGKGDLMEDIMLSRPGDTPSSGDHGPLVCEIHGRTQGHESLPTGRHSKSHPTGRECQFLQTGRHGKSKR